MSVTIVATENDMRLSAIATSNLAKAHGLDVNDPKLKGFMDQIIVNTARGYAWQRFYTNILNTTNYSE